MMIAIWESTSNRGVISSRKITDIFTNLDVKAISKVLLDVKSRKIITSFSFTVEQFPRSIVKYRELKEVNGYKVANNTKMAKLNSQIEEK